MGVSRRRWEFLLNRGIEFGTQHEGEAAEEREQQERDRGGEHPERHLASYAGLMQADAYAGFNRLYESNRKPGPIIEAACWAHARRKFFDLARINNAPIATEAVERIDALFAIEREVNGVTPQERVRIRDERSRLLVITLGSWLREQRARVSKNSDTGKAIDYSLKRWNPFDAWQEHIRKSADSVGSAFAARPDRDLRRAVVAG